MKAYLKKAINRWYANAKIDYNIDGHFVDAITDGHNLTIIVNEEGRRFKTTIGWYDTFTAEQIYNIWMEADWEVA